MTIPAGSHYDSGLMYRSDSDRNKEYGQNGNATSFPVSSTPQNQAPYNAFMSSSVPTASLLELTSNSSSSTMGSFRPRALSSGATAPTTTDYPIAPAFAMPPTTIAQDHVSSSSSTMDPFSSPASKNSNSTALVVYNQNGTSAPPPVPATNSFSAEGPDAINQIYVEEDPADKKKRRRRRRRVRMAVGAASGVVVGGVLLGPVGVVAGAVTGVVVTRAASKHGERRKDARVAAAKAEADAVMGVDRSQDVNTYRSNSSVPATTQLGAEHVIV